MMEMSWTPAFFLLRIIPDLIRGRDGPTFWPNSRMMPGMEFGIRRNVGCKEYCRSLKSQRLVFVEICGVP